jgi:hypothetical protein
MNRFFKLLFLVVTRRRKGQHTGPPVSIDRRINGVSGSAFQGAISFELGYRCYPDVIFLKVRLLLNYLSLNLFVVVPKDREKNLGILSEGLLLPLNLLRAALEFEKA